MNKQEDILTKLSDEDKQKGHILPLLPLPDSKDNTFFVIHSWMITHLNLSGNDLFLFGIIFGFCNNTGNVCYCGRDYLSSVMNVTNITVTRSVKNLEDRNLIIVDRVQTKDKSKNYYSINVEELIKVIKDKSKELEETNEDIKTDVVEEEIKDTNNNLVAETNTIENSVETVENTIYEKEIQKFNYECRNVYDTSNKKLLPQLQNVTTTGNKLLDYNIGIYNIKDNIENNKIKNFIVEPKTAETEINTPQVSNSVKSKKTDKNAEFHLGYKKTKKRTNDKPRMFALIKQTFLNDTINEPELVEALTRFLQQRISRKDAIKMTYNLWEQQLQLLIKVSEGDYKYALGLVNDAYNGGYRAVCFSNQQKTKPNKYNKKMSYNLETNETNNKIANMTRKERKEYYDANIALDENGNPLTF